MDSTILPKICTVDGCSNKKHSKGLCSTHYSLMWRNGSPTSYHPRYKCRDKWLRKHVEWMGDECLKWPFAVSDHGRGVVTIDGKIMSAPRAMCMLAHGLPPTSSHQCAHSCGKGHEGCVNPRHLRWATAAENERDKLAHGTLRRGSNVNTSKLSKEQAIEIIRRGKSAGVNAMAEEYGVSPTAISYILSGKNWGWLPR